MSERSVNLTTLFLGRLRPPKRLTSTSCTYFRQELTTALLEKAEGETNVARPVIEPRTTVLWFLRIFSGVHVYVGFPSEVFKPSSSLSPLKIFVPQILVGISEGPRRQRKQRGT